MQDIHTLFTSCGYLCIIWHLFVKKNVNILRKCCQNGGEDDCITYPPILKNIHVSIKIPYL